MEENGWLLSACLPSINGIYIGTGYTYLGLFDAAVTAGVPLLFTADVLFV